MQKQEKSDQKPNLKFNYFLGLRVLLNIFEKISKFLTVLLKG